MTLLLDDLDSLPISDHAPGDRLPGGARGADRLGVGHRCETWLAFSDELWAPVVVKFPRPHQIEHPRARRSLSREVAALADNPHPALPRLYVDGTAAPTPFTVCEYVDGPALDAEIDARGGLGDVEVALLGGQLLAALRTVHRRRLAHVDLKPANVVLRDGRPVLLDFGSARPLGAGQPTGLLIGSPGYASPDLEAGADISAAMDVYGLGVTLWEARTGRPAFDVDLAAADRPALPWAADSPVGAVVARLVDPDPASRPTVDQALVELTALGDPSGVLLWPAWAR